MYLTGIRRWIHIRQSATGNRASVALGQGGFITRGDLLIILLVVPALAATGWFTIRRAYGLRYESPPTCLVEMAGIADRIRTSLSRKDQLPMAAIGAAKCPQAKAPYSVQVQLGRWRICCPDPANHLAIEFPVSCLSEKGWLQVGPEGGGGTGNMPVALLESFLSPLNWSVEKRPGSGLKIKRVGRWSRILPVAALALLLPYAGILIFTLVMNKRESEKRSTLKTILTVSPAVFAVGLCYAIWLGVWGGGAWLLLSSREATFDKNAMTLSSRLFPFSEKREIVERYRILAVGEDDGVFVAFHDDKGLIKAFRMRLADAGEARDLARSIRDALVLEANE